MTPTHLVRTARLRPLVQVLAGALLLSVPCRAFAYNEQTHQELTDYAYEVMKIMQRDPAFFAGLSVNLAGDPAWRQFVADAGNAVPYLQSLPGAIPTPRTTTCDASDYIANIPNDFANKKLGEMRFALRHDYNEAAGCGLLGMPCSTASHDANAVCHQDKRAWSPEGIFASTNPNDKGEVDYTGLTLGYWAAHVDHEYEDTRTQIRPTNVLVGGAKREITDLAQDGIASLLVPIVCAWKWLTGDDDDCWKSAKDIARSLDPVENLEGMVPGFSNDVDPKWTGIWHFINMNPGATNDYDDRPGWYPPEGGPRMKTGLGELGVIALANLKGLSIDYEPANGPKRYTIENGSDYHEDSRVRNESQWQYATISHTVMEPLDNLAFYGWRQFLSYERTAKSLQWPLHALGDAAEPHHTVGSSGWGHRPYEDAVADRTTWELLRMIPPTLDASRPLEVPSVRTPINLPPTSPAISQAPLAYRLQLEQIVRVAENAFRWRKFILDWRARHPDKKRDIPIRDMVTQLARETYDYSIAMDEVTFGEWPFQDWASARYEMDAEGAAIRTYTEQAGFIELARVPVENSMAATLAFLTSVSEVQ